MSDPLKNILFLSIPEEMEQVLDNFSIDPSILLPVEVPEGAGKDWDFQDLSWEMIISAMLKIMAWQPDHEDIPYYRGFVKAAKPDIVELLARSALIKLGNKDYDLAQEITYSLIGLEPEEAVHRMNLAMLFENRSRHYASIGNEEESLNFEKSADLSYQEIFSLDNPLPEAFFYYGLFLVRKKDYRKGVELLESFIAQRGGSEMSETLSDVDLDENDSRLEKAKSIILECEKYNLSDKFYKEAFEAIKEGKEEVGIEKITSYLEQFPESWSGWFLLGWAHRRKGEFTEALKAFKKSSEYSDGKQIDLFNEMAICYMELGDYEQCGKLLDDALKLEPDNLKVISNLGILKLKQGDKAGARQFFEIALTIEPEDQISMQYLEYLEG